MRKFDIASNTPVSPPSDKELIESFKKNDKDQENFGIDLSKKELEYGDKVKLEGGSVAIFLFKRKASDCIDYNSSNSSYLKAVLPKNEDVYFFVRLEKNDRLKEGYGMYYMETNNRGTNIFHLDWRFNVSRAPYEEIPLLSIFEQSIYPFDFYVYVGTEDLSHIFKDFPHETDFHARTLLLRNKKNNQKSLLISFRDAEAMTLDFIVHECVHAANAVSYDIGQDKFHDIGQDESYCYLVAWMVRCCDQTREVIKGGKRDSFKGKLIRVD